MFKQRKDVTPTSSQNAQSRESHYPSLRSILILLSVLVLITIFAYYIYSNRDKYLALFHASVEAVIFLVFAGLISLFVNGLISTLLYRGLEANLSYREGFYLAAASTLANQLPISGGVITRSVYLKQKHNLPYTKFIGATLALFVCFISANGLIGTGILIYWVIYRNISPSPFLLGGFILMFTSLLVFLLPIDKIQFPKKLEKWAFRTVEGWGFARENPILLAKLVSLQIVLMLVLAIRYWLAFHMLSQDVSFGDVILFSSASVLTQLISIAPGGLGITEIIVGFIASTQGFEVGVSIVAVTIDRLILTSLTLLAGGISAIILGKNL